MIRAWSLLRYGEALVTTEGDEVVVTEIVVTLQSARHVWRVSEKGSWVEGEGMGGTSRS